MGQLFNVWMALVLGSWKEANLLVGRGDATLDAPIEECDDKKNASGDGYDEGSFFELCGDSPLKNGSIFFFHFD